jgi:CubicO group peptidase (beta-lactamase class C family)
MVGEARPGVPIADQTILLWLSSGKPVTATAIALLQQGGQLSVEHPVTMYIPEFAAAGKQAITVRQLLTHTAGLHRVIASAFETTDWPSTIARICAAPVAPGFIPGQHAAYDPSAAWFVLGEIIARVAAEPFERFVGREIFERADMPDAAYSFTDEQAARISARLAQYSIIRAGQRHLLNWNEPPVTRLARPGASLRATIGEMANFYSALVAGRLLRLETLKLFTSPTRGLIADRTFGTPMDWGLGFMVKGDPRAAYSFGPQASERAFGHGGQQTSIAFADPEKGIVLVAAYTTLPGERQHNGRMAELIVAAFADG